jgi:hypothetical protein
MDGSVNLFLENQKIKNENNDLKDTISKIESELDIIADILLQIKDRPIMVNQVMNSINKEHPKFLQEIKEKEEPKYFIPEIDVSNKEVKSADLNKRSRKINLDDSVQKLQNMTI